MQTVTQEYYALVADVKRHLQEEFNSGTWLTTDSETLEYFRCLALRAANNKQPYPVKAASMPAPPVAASSTPITVSRRSQDLPPISAPQRETVPAQPREVTSIAEPKALGNVSIEGRARPPAAVEPAAQPPKVKDKSLPAAPFQREYLPQATADEFSDLKHFMAESYPQITVHTRPPDDAAAKPFMQQWHCSIDFAQVLIFTFDENNIDKTFLTNVQQAIDIALGKPTALYQAYKSELLGNWSELLANNHLRLILTHMGKMESLKTFMAHYREEPRPHAGKIPILPLCDIALYMQEPHLKMKLWQEITTLLK
jgi:hypothetical protein